ncbi:MAG: NHL repeat-containing protein [Armatimonadetes bacterium]|nr:NHL repeat-containing protein [Armatimonadota bacterium]
MKEWNLVKRLLDLVLLATLALPFSAKADYVAPSNPNGAPAFMVQTDDAGNYRFSFGQGIISYPINSVYDANGLLYVADYGTGKVLRFGPNGSYLGEFADVHDQISYIAFHPDGSLLVGRYVGGTVWRFAADGTPMGEFISDDGLTRHGQMIFDSAGNFYVCSWTDHKILRYDSAGNFIDEFSSFDRSGIEGPVGIAFNADGQMYVSEYLNYTVKVLDANGDYLYSLFSTFSEIEYLTVDGDGSILMPYFYANTIHRFAADGTDLGEFTPVDGTYHITKTPEFVEPNAITIVRGRQDAGDVASLATIDNNSLRVCRFIVLNSTDPPVQVTVRGTSPVTSPSGLSAVVTSRVTITGLFAQDFIMVKNNGQLSGTVRRTDQIGLGKKSVAISADLPSDYVAGDGTVRVRYNIRPVGPTASVNWCDETDMVAWSVVP